MADNSRISWCDATWNPFRGCTRVSPGCQNCYAERMCSRGLPGLKSPTTGEDFALKTPSGPRWTGRVELIEGALEIPLRWRSPRRIFVNSMSDTFHEAVPDEWIDRVFAVMALCPQHTFIVCTKRVSRMREFLGADLRFRLNAIFRHGCEMGKLSGGLIWQSFNPTPTPLPHVILLASVEDQVRAHERIPELLATPAAVRGISLEPMLGPVDLRRYLGCQHQPKDGSGDIVCNVCCHAEANPAALQWVIIGGESGPGARPCNVEWVRDVVRKCREAGMPVFVKQVWVYRCRRCGACFEDPQDFGHDGCGSDDPTHDVLPYLSKEPSEWPSDLRIQHWPEVRR